MFQATEFKRSDSFCLHTLVQSIFFLKPSMLRTTFILFEDLLVQKLSGFLNIFETYSFCFVQLCQNSVRAGFRISNLYIEFAIIL